MELGDKVRKAVVDHVAGTDASRNEKKIWNETDVYDHLLGCEICDSDKADGRMLVCDGCDNLYRVLCLNPLLALTPRGEWFCSSAVLQFVSWWRRWQRSWHRDRSYRWQFDPATEASEASEWTADRVTLVRQFSDCHWCRLTKCRAYRIKLPAGDDGESHRLDLRKNDW